MKLNFSFNAVAAILLLLHVNTSASRLISMQSIDNQCIVLHFQDGYVEYNWDDTTGTCNGWDPYNTETWSLCPDKDQYIPYGDPLNTSIINMENTFHIISGMDANYGTSGKSPMKVNRKSKVWEASFDENMPAMHHWVYLELPSALKNGVTYNLKIASYSNTDQLALSFEFDEKELISPAIKVSNTGYEASAVHKSADVYVWMGDGGERDYSRFNGSNWHLYNVYTGKYDYSGELAFRMENKNEPEFDADFTMSDIWECDFSEFTDTGTYKLVIEGIGSSYPFEIRYNIFNEPFKVAMQGMFYQRMGCEDKPSVDFPRSRTPLFKKDTDPLGFKVLISEKNMVTGKNPDDRNFYADKLTGETAEATWGGWSDAYDNDQRPVNFVCVFDLLLTYYLNPETFTDNQLYIPEWNNEIPDIIDEALWEIDWWLRMRDSEGGYLTGLTNIRPPENVNYAGAPCAWQGWCVAGACAMAADCFRRAGMDALEEKYRREAITAFNWAASQTDQMLDIKVDELRGRDLKMTAAAYLYNLTGDKSYESIVMQESVAKGPQSKIRDLGKHAQQYASVAYIMSPQQVTDIQLQKNMKKSIIHQAKVDYVDKMKNSPTKANRWTSKWEGMFQTSNEMSLVAIAHKLAIDKHDKQYFEKGLYAEAEWTLGRNPLGLVQMTGLGERCITQTFAPGRRDGYTGVTPGWTPYMCRDGWNNSDHIVRCEFYTNRNYPEEKELWPYGEHFWNSRYSVPNSETTPQQTFRQKIVLYGYLFSLNR